ncbi:MAG TPA: TSUP family transporter [Candidatus Solibacter sp.]|nr:TSUP family transporter [Candidatus Solibacter sp.]
MNQTVMLVFLGLVAGVLSGLIGIGGGVVVVPALVFMFGFSQHRAEGTTLALLVPPIGLLAVLPFFRQGYVDIRAAAFICVGFLFGGLIGGHLATALSNIALQRIFGVALLIIGARMLIAR